ncbi:MAG: hypothetical protein BWX69_03146 [Planctomycetes bacterium ADurb.Bin069]|nr:MAG: hypothetical protein BWX69_03146 [Planctomycetes bacterium ADurb.Bin069]
MDQVTPRTRGIILACVGTILAGTVLVAAVDDPADRRRAAQETAGADLDVALGELDAAMARVEAARAEARRPISELRKQYGARADEVYELNQRQAAVAARIAQLKVDELAKAFGGKHPDARKP